MTPTIKLAYDAYIAAGKLEYKPRSHSKEHARNLKLYREARKNLCELLETDYLSGNMKDVRIERLRKKLAELEVNKKITDGISVMNYQTERRMYEARYYDRLIEMYREWAAE